MVEADSGSVQLPVTCKLHGGPWDGDRIVLPYARLRIELSAWEGPFMTDCETARYRLRPRWNGGPEADYDFMEPSDLEVFRPSGLAVPGGPVGADVPPTSGVAQVIAERGGRYRDWRRIVLRGVLAVLVLAAVRWRQQLGLEVRGIVEAWRETGRTVESVRREVLR